MRSNWLSWVAAVTRRFHPRGTERVLRFIHNPDKHAQDGLETVVPYAHGLRLHVNTGSFIEWKVFFYGYYERNIMELIAKYLPPGGTFVDVGANIGIHALTAAKIAGRVIAIEPVPVIRTRLLSNIQLNDLHNIEIVPLVASDRPGTVSFYEPVEAAANKGAGSLYKSRADGKEIRVKSETLDEILKNESRVDFIKIDTEGNDGKVILGALRTIQEYKPAILFEYASGWAPSGVSPAEVMTKLTALDYELFAVKNYNLRAIKDATDWDRFNAENILTRPRSA